MARVNEHITFGSPPDEVFCLELGHARHLGALAAFWFTLSCMPLNVLNLIIFKKSGRFFNYSASLHFTREPSLST